MYKQMTSLWFMERLRFIYGSTGGEAQGVAVDGWEGFRALPVDDFEGVFGLVGDVEEEVGFGKQSGDGWLGFFEEGS